MKKYFRTKIILLSALCCLLLAWSPGMCSAADYQMSEQQLQLQEQNLQQLKLNLEMLKANSTASEQDYLMLLNDLSNLKQSLEKARSSSIELQKQLAASLIETEQTKISLMRVSNVLSKTNADLATLEKQLKREQLARRAERVLWAAGAAFLLLRK